MRVILPPHPISGFPRRVFLAGSIEMDNASRWQDFIIEQLKDTDITVLNPRREEWDSSWKQEMSNPVFKDQVSWELEGLEQAEMIVMYLDPGTRAPISLLELGLHARSGKMVVCCPEGFWRKGNVDVVCERYHIPLVTTLNALCDSIRKRLL